MPIPTAAAPRDRSTAFCLVDAEGRQLDGQDEHRPYYAASTIKLHVLLAALQAADRGELALGMSVPATRTFSGADGAAFTLGGDHLDATHPADGEPITVADLLWRLIDRSSNEATNHVITLLGGPEGAQGGLGVVARAISTLGLPRTRVERLIGDDAALRRGATNETSAADLTATIHALVSGRRRGLLRPASLEFAREALRAQRIRIICTALPAGLDCGSKSGWVEGYRHDVAFIGDPGGSDLRALAVMTAGQGESEADQRILALTRAHIAV